MATQSFFLSCDIHGSDFFNLNLEGFFNTFLDLNLVCLWIHFKNKLVEFFFEESGLLKEEFNQFVFEVDPKANKVQIKESVEKAFKVEVEKVRTMNVTGKKKRLGRHQGKKSNWKKALITLKEGQTIEYFEGA